MKQKDLASAMASMSALMTPPPHKQTSQASEGLQYNDYEARKVANMPITKGVVNAVKMSKSKSEERLVELSRLVTTFSRRQINDFVMNGLNITRNEEGIPVVSIVGLGVTGYGLRVRG